MLAEIKRAREAALTAEAEAKAAQRRAEALNADLRYRLAKIEEARREVLAEARAQAQAELAAVRAEIDALREGLAVVAEDASQPAGQEPARALAGRGRGGAGAARCEDSSPLPSAEMPEPVVVDGPLQPGDQVWVPRSRLGGEVVGVCGRRGGGQGRRLPRALAPSRVELRQRGQQPGDPDSGRRQPAQAAQPRHGARPARPDGGRHADRA